MSYDGRLFRGFQLQEGAHSIQAHLENAFRTFFRKSSLRIGFTSRTDSGVHAEDQWVIMPEGVKILNSLPASIQRRMLRSLNSILGPSVQIWKGMKIREDFHPKKNVKWKEYIYTIWVGFADHPHFHSQMLHLHRMPDVVAMQKALKSLEGQHDFTAFAKQSLKGKNRSGIRTIFKADLRMQPDRVFQRHVKIELIFRADGFHQHMVRNIVGTLLEIGRGRVISIHEILRSRDRRRAGSTAPPHALRLHKTQIDPRFWQELPPFIE